MADDASLLLLFPTNRRLRKHNVPTVPEFESRIECSPTTPDWATECPMTLQQNQVWRQGDHFLRIVQLERMRVNYKLMQNLSTKEGSHHQATKKDFCRLLKGASLLTAAEAEALGATPPPTPLPPVSEVITDEPDPPSAPDEAA
jgi:hypothetical protein